MYRFPAGLYADVRIEDVFETKIAVTLGEVEELKDKRFTAAFVRLFDGARWFYSATTDVEQIQQEIDSLAAMATPKPEIAENEIVRKLEANRGEHLIFSDDDDVSRVSKESKYGLLARYFPLIEGQDFVASWTGNYVDQKVVKTFVSSKGADLKFDYQRVGIWIAFSLADGENRLSEIFNRGANHLRDLEGLEGEIAERYREAVCFLQTAVEVVPGAYTTVLSPLAAGIFAHESFGHKSESDFMLGDETMQQEWQLGKVVGSPILSILDDGQELGAGYTPFDDEGTRARKTRLIDKGVLTGRLHNGSTAADLHEGLTGNGRSVSFEFEPIVRMTTTYIDKGDLEFDQLLAPIGEGILVKTIKHGSGMSTFTLAPSLAYMIRDGRVAEPVKISVVSGTVFKALGEIDGLTDQVELLCLARGGCGKMEQYPLPVGFGGPWVRVRSLNVQ
jgi:TldD protein